MIITIVPWLESLTWAKPRAIHSSIIHSSLKVEGTYCPLMDGWISKSESESRPVVTDSLWPHELYSPWNFPGQNTGVDSLSFLQGISPGSKDPRIKTQVSHIAGGFFTNWAVREAHAKVIHA